MARALPAYRGLVAALAIAAASCGVRTPPPLDVAALVRAEGAVGARRHLEVSVIAAPRDVQARLALAALADEQGRPAQAIEQLEAVLSIGGPLGTRWHVSDRARLGELLAVRGRARLARAAPSAAHDLQRARELGARVDDATLAAARRAVAIARLRHVDAGERAAGMRMYRELERVDDRGALGARLWALGARRAAWEELAAWASATSSRDPAIHARYLEARAWWTPIDGEPPPADHLVGPGRCRFAAAGCRAARGLDDEAVDALVAGPSTPTLDPDAASAWVAITLREALRGRGSWGALLAARVEIDAIDERRIAPFARAAFTLLKRTTTGEPNIPEPAPLDALASDERLVVAAARALRGLSAREVTAALGPVASSPDGIALIRLAAPAAPAPPMRAREVAVATYARARLGAVERTPVASPSLTALEAIAVAYARDPAIADRLARELVATSVDAAVGHAALGALFDALGDPARARAAWQGAVDASPSEVALQRGLASALARANDPDAALVVATGASAASGDPAVVWLEIARALHGVGHHVHALDAVRFAIELAGPAVYVPALDVAIAANRALGRGAQIAMLEERRAASGLVRIGTARVHDPTDATSDDAERIWIASRWQPRNIALRAALIARHPASDIRHRLAITELIALAADEDVELARAAVRAIPR